MTYLELYKIICRSCIEAYMKDLIHNILSEDEEYKNINIYDLMKYEYIQNIIEDSVHEMMIVNNDDVLMKLVDSAEECIEKSIIKLVGVCSNKILDSSK